MTFHQLKAAHHWQPIPHCPGRYKLVDESPYLPMERLLDTSQPIRQFRSKHALDFILVTELEQGGLISYQRRDGTYLHTLNTPDGFIRKLKQLDICIHSIEHTSSID